MNPSLWIGVGVMLVLLIALALALPVQPPTGTPIELATPETATPDVATVTEPAMQPEPEVEETPPAEEPVAVPEVPAEPPAVIPEAIDGIVFPGEYAHWTDAGGFEVHWTNDLNYLRVGLVSPGAGYVAIGFDPEYRMRGANFILGAVEDGRLVMRDDYGDGSVSHTADTFLGGTNDILEGAGREVDGRTTIEFVIPLETRDAMDKTLVPGETYKILVAYHETSDLFTARHSRRGSGMIRLDDR